MGTTRDIILKLEKPYYHYLPKAHIITDFCNALSLPIEQFMDEYNKYLKQKKDNLTNE